ncbi:hypothetical protein ACJX0J_025765 [Zea mays]
MLLHALKTKILYLKVGTRLTKNVNAEVNLQVILANKKTCIQENSKYFFIQIFFSLHQCNHIKTILSISGSFFALWAGLIEVACNKYRIKTVAGFLPIGLLLIGMEVFLLAIPCFKKLYGAVGAVSLCMRCFTTSEPTILIH